MDNGYLTEDQLEAGDRVNFAWDEAARLKGLAREATKRFEEAVKRAEELEADAYR